MKITLSEVFAFGEKQSFKKLNVNYIATFCTLFFLIFNSQNTFSQTISSSGSSATTCGDCTPTGWLDNGGTPDISNRTNAGGQGSLGGNDTWAVSPLPLPPTGDLTWITMRDIGDYNGSTVESIKTDLGEIITGNLYRLTIYVMTAKSNGDGGDYYSGAYLDQFSYDLNKPGVAPITQIVTLDSNAHDKWDKREVIFIGDPDASTMELSFSPLDNAVTSGNDINFESIHIAIQLNDISLLDSDGDGVVDLDDLDDDNDGILDTDEITSSNDPLGDADGDKLPNYLDSDFSLTTGNGGIPDEFDFDDDGIPNHLDLDSDNDGIPDNIEAQTTAGYIAPSGSVGEGFTDVDGDGIDDKYDSDCTPCAINGTAITPVNSDSATVTDNPDYLDTDSDNDGVSDTIEANIILSGTVGKNGLDSTYDNGDGYTDVNGIFDDTQTDNFPDEGSNAGSGLPNDVNWRDIAVTGFIDTDGDGVPNFADIDDDNDGIPDAVEQGLLCPGFLTYEYFDGNYSPSVDNIPLTGATETGTVTNFDVDDLIDNVLSVTKEDFGLRYTGYINIATTETYTFYTTSDDGSKLFINGIEVLDNDGNHDLVEASGTINLSPGIYSFTVLFYERSGGEFLSVQYSSPTITKVDIPFASLNCNIDETVDSDNDGIPNYLDLDSDNDGIPDNIEAQATATYIAPSGAPGAGFIDLNGNGLDDNYEALQGGSDITPLNTDSAADAIPDYLDTDSDNDGTSDRREANLILTGQYGLNGLDSSYESTDGYADVNGTFDNTPFGEFPDTPSGGEIDWRDFNVIFSDNDGDGIVDSLDLDDDNDGILDSVEGGNLECSATVFTTLVRQLTDNGPFTDSQDIDLTSLGVNIGDEVNLTNLLADGDLTNAGTEVFSLTVNDETPITGLQTGIDCNGSLTTVTTPISLNTIVKDIGGGVPGVTLEVSYGNDVNFCTNRLEYTIDITCVSVFGLDTDNDGIPNYLDLDSDNDGIPDNIEAQATLGYVTPDGVFDTDGVDTEYSGGLTPEDTDNDGIPDYLDTDSDDDGILDNTEAGIILTGEYGVNGLDNAYDNGDNYHDVNGSFDNSQSDNFPDVDNDVFNAGDVDYRDDTFTVDYDDDGISDELDLDDDNDGITDLVELGQSACEDILDPGNGELNWDSQYAEGDATITNGDDPIETNSSITNNNVGITLSRTSNVASGSNYRINDAITTNSSYNLNQSGTFGALSRHTFVFDSPVYGPSFVLYDVNQDNGNTQDKVQVIFTKIDGSTYNIVTADYTIDNAANNGFTTSNTFEGVGGGSSNITINRIPEWIIQIQIVYENSGTGDFGSQQDIAIGNITYCTPIDTDNDGVFDFKDLDADNDGIPDNIEAQSTNGYIPPTGNYSIFGIDLAYDTGLTPVDTDGTEKADYLDLDSDGDGTNDVLESGLTTLPNDGSMVTGAVGINGLLDTLDDDGTGDTDGDGLGEGTGDNYKDVNGTFDSTQTDNFTDGDTDASIGGDLDYRDTVVGVDTDGDGIANSVDTDDDNDGIPDVNEGACVLTYSIIGTIDGSRDRSSASVDSDLNRDFIFGDNYIVRFAFATPTQVTIQTTIGDNSNARTGTVTVDSVDEAISTASNNFQTVTHSPSTLSTYDVNIVGADMTVTHIEVFDSNGNVIVQLDFGTSSSILANSYLRVDEVFTSDTKAYTCLTSTDTDLDGVPDYLDIDADNDGIPDNVEAQTTLGYQAPSGVDTDNDGLDDAYDTDCAPCGGTTGVDLSSPYNDDGTDNPDYLDTDSDNDGIFDISENNVSDANDAILDANTGDTTDGTPDGIIDPSNFVDSDGDGLADIFEGSDVNDGYDVNDEIDTPSINLPDADSDVNAGVDGNSDVDFRDGITGTVSPGVAGNILWLRADLEVTGTTTVTSWVDQTTSAHIAESPTGEAPAKVDNGLNFNPTIDFDGTNDDLFIDNGILGTDTYTDIWVYLVSNTSVVGSDTPFRETMANSELLSAHVPWSDNNLYFDFGNNNPASGRIFSNWGATAGEFNLWTMSSSTITDTPTGSRKNLSRNGFSFSVSNSDNSGSTRTGNNSDFNIGSSNGGAEFYDGEIAEIMVFSGIPSDKKQQHLQSYLAIKYGITLDDTDTDAQSLTDENIIDGDYILADEVTKIWNYTTNSAYHNDVAGIGRDDAMALGQYQSKSINDDAIITIGLDAIAASNNDNVNYPAGPITDVNPPGIGFDSNKDFLVWGNNNGSVAAVDVLETELICAPEKTLARTWKIVENGNVGKTQIAADKVTIDLALTTANTVKVFKVADDAAFTTNVEYIPVIANGAGTLYEVDYNFNGTKYFTYSEINGIFWNGDANAWSGGNSGTLPGGPSTNPEDRDKVMIIDSETSLTNITLTESVEVECVWIKENSKLMVATNAYLEFDEDFILDGELRLIGDGQLIQTHIGLSNVEGSGKMYKDQTALVPNVYRYHYWTSPVRELSSDNFRVGHVLKDGTIPTSETSEPLDINFTSSGYDGSVGDYTTDPLNPTPITIASYWIYTNLNDPGDGSAWIRQRETGVIQRGQGFSMKSTGGEPDPTQGFTFVGTPNDGSITFTIDPNTTSLLGNPYASALDINDFITTNTDAIDGTLYFWEHTGEDANTSGSEGHNFSGYQGGYSQRNISMGIAANNVVSATFYNFNWETDTTDNPNDVTQNIIDIDNDLDVTATVSFSTGGADITDNLNEGGSSDNVVVPTTATGSYTMTVDFDKFIDTKSIFIYNDIGLAGDVVTLTISTPNGSSNADVTHTITGNTGAIIPLNWTDVKKIVVSGDADFNIALDNIIFTKGGEISFGDGEYHAPNRYMSVAQGFFVSASPTGGTIRFENAQRNYKNNTFSTGGTYFFRGINQRTEEEEVDLLPVIKLGLGYYNGNDIPLHRQIGISFRTANSFKYDNGYDSDIFDVNPTDMYWNFDQEPDKNLIIAGVGPITNQLEVPLSLEIDTEDKVVLMVDEKRNINQTIYIYDKLTGVYYDMENQVELDLEKGTYKDRFYLTFNKSSLSVDNVDIVDKALNTYVNQIQKELIVQNLENLEINKIELFNILGQSIRKWNVNSTETAMKFDVKNIKENVYIVKVYTALGNSSKKIIIE
jgi:hypothetical protein